jgi:HlyD family secretion protein/hemolysin D
MADLESQQLLVETRAELEITRSKITSLDAAIGGLEQKTAASLRDRDSVERTAFAAHRFQRLRCRRH